MQDKLTMMRDFTDVKTREGGITKLLKEIRTISLKIETNTSVYDALDKENSMYYTYKQENGESNAKQLRNFKSIVSVIEYLGGTSFSDKKLIKVKKEMNTKLHAMNKTDTEYTIVVKKKMLGVAFLKRAFQQRYSKIMTSIR